MKIINGTASSGRHAVELLAESAAEEDLLRRWFNTMRRQRALRARLTQTESDKYPALQLQEWE